MSHELKTPLTVIDSYNQLLCDGRLGKLSKKQKDALCTTKESIDHLKSIMDELLDIKKYEVGKPRFFFEEIDVVNLLKDNTAKFGATLEQIGGSVSVDNKIKKLNISIDKKKMSQVFMNLLSNSIKYRKQDVPLKIKVTINTLEKDAIITFSDNGLGIPKKDQAMIFKRFYQVEKIATKSVEGVGLGLAIVSEIIKYHGGRIEAKGKLGLGTDMIITLPIKKRK